jgi:hypothetical protein
MTFRKHFLEENAAGEAKGGGAGAAGSGQGAGDVTKALVDAQKPLLEEIKKLNQRVDKLATPAPAPKQKKEETDDDDEVDLLLNPKKAVEKITRRVESELTNKFAAENTARDKFNTKFSEMAGDFPEINDVNSDLHKRAREILEGAGGKGWDANALEAAVLRAASEKGVLPVKHRRRSDEGDEGDDYLGGGSSGGDSGRGSRRRNSSEKLPAATLAFAEAVGMNVTDPKVVERLTKTHNARRGNWNKYK